MAPALVCLCVCVLACVWYLCVWQDRLEHINPLSAQSLSQLPSHWWLVCDIIWSLFCQPWPSLGIGFPFSACVCRAEHVCVCGCECVWFRGWGCDIHFLDNCAVETFVELWFPCYLISFIRQRDKIKQRKDEQWENDRDGVNELKVNNIKYIFFFFSFFLPSCVSSGRPAECDGKFVSESSHVHHHHPGRHP